MSETFPEAEPESADRFAEPAAEPAPLDDQLVALGGLFRWDAQEDLVAGHEGWPSDDITEI